MLDIIKLWDRIRNNLEYKKIERGTLKGIWRKTLLKIKDKQWYSIRTRIESKSYKF